MFDRITFATQNKLDGNNPIDLGHLAECMIFYKSTYVIASQGILKQLIKYFGVDGLIELLDSNVLHIIYTESMVGVSTNTEGSRQFYDVVEMSSPQHLYQDVLRKQIVEVTGKAGKGRRLANKIQDKIKVTNHDHSILDGTRHSILNQQYIQTAANLVLNSKLNGSVDLSGLRFQTEKQDRGIVVSTNTNFLILNQVYHKFVPATHSSLTPASILAEVLDLEKELCFASNNVSEIAASQISSTLAKNKFDYIFEQSYKTEEKINNFSDFALDNAQKLRDAVNNKKITAKDVIQIIEKSHKFKSWLTKKSPESDLIKEYYAEVTKETVADKLPGKTARFSVFTGLGLAADATLTGGLGTVAGLSLGALDTFYLDKLLSGWKPNQFIDDQLLPVINKKT
ncbi:hypothetical protein MIB92_05610 [Aestuariirhabdus sp. Z084]|uniref:hypothetical protein n=1 Tax=Aestuariirhabdus haliotis TaxID=2918751 RepID=UPI00201B39BC|nr:hypothetical protein [Aestuariirhabdus haliotis]MCL6415119.1 hypothetical protein [Aestuariirhabdus haliotis]MCL6419051.1 hypothetical protein [Aestuariirhabdus haliotis]